MKTLKILCINFLIVLLILSIHSCSDEECGTCPKKESCDFPPGNRSFTWRMDTVAWWPSTLGGIHAFSDDDAWVMGDMYGPVVNGKNTSYVALHWNGHAWDDTLEFLDLFTLAYDVAGDDRYLVAAGYLGYHEGEKPSIAEFDNRTQKWKAENIYYGSSGFEVEGALTSLWTDGKGFFIAVGWNGMVYTKDGYDADWVYSKAPTDFHFERVVGINKNELYLLANVNLAGGHYFQQYWRLMNNQWTKLYDGQDTTGTVVKLYNTDNAMYDVAAWRCSVTDSLCLYLIGWESFLLESAGESLNYSITNLTDLGLPLRNIGRTGFDITLFTPNDIWIFGSRYNFYHWNGSDFARMTLPGLPDDDLQFGNQQKMIKTSTGKVFLPTEISSQVYVVMQGTP